MLAIRGRSYGRMGKHKKRPVNTVAPVLSGIPTVGQTISCTTGVWTGLTPITYYYQGARDGVGIAGANSNSYVLTLADVGKMMQWEVYAENADGPTAHNALSNTLGPVTAIPTLSAVSAIDFSDIFVWARATTDGITGTLYAVVVPSGAPAPSGAQIAAGTDGAGTAATSSNNVVISSSGVKNILLRGLTAVTSYTIYMTHKLGAPIYSAVASASFTTDTLMASFATNGLATGLGVSTGCGPFGTNIADPHGGTNAVRFVDNAAGGTNQVVFSCGPFSFFNGVNKIHITAKTQSGAAWIRQAPISITVGSVSAWYNTSTGATGTVGGTWSPTPVVFDVNGWKMWSSAINLAGADVLGTWNINKGMVDNNIGNIPLDGTNIQDLYNIRITRV